MAPGLPDVAIQYNITSPTIAALTLSSFLITFAFGVRFINLFIHYLVKISFTAAHHGAIVRDIWTYLGEQALNLAAIFILHKLEGPSYRQCFFIGFLLGVCILPNDRLTNRLSDSLYVIFTPHTDPILINLFASAGLAGSAPIAIGGGTVADLFSEGDRATAMAFYNFGPLLGM